MESLQKQNLILILIEFYLNYGLIYIYINIISNGPYSHGILHKWLINLNYFSYMISFFYDLFILDSSFSALN